MSNSAGPVDERFLSVTDSKECNGFPDAEVNLYLVISGVYYNAAETYIKGCVSMIQARIPSGNL